MYLFNLKPETDEVTFSNYVAYDINSLDPADKIVMEPINYFKNTFNSCFDVLKRLAQVANYWIQRPEDEVEHHFEQIKISVVTLLMTQDICDNRKLRQGKSTAHETYGVSRTISSILCSGLALLSMKEYETKDLDIQQIPKKYINARDLHIELTDRTICPSEELYYQICGNRGTLMHFTNESFYMHKGHGTKKIDLSQLMTKIKIFLTIVDECRRLAVNNTDDIEAGHFSFPMIYAINKNQDDGEIVLDVMRKRTNEEAVLKYALSILRRSDCLEYAKQKLSLLRKEIFEEYKKLDKNPFMDDFVNDYLEIPEQFEDITWQIS